MNTRCNLRKVDLLQTINELIGNFTKENHINSAVFAILGTKISKCIMS